MIKNYFLFITLFSINAFCQIGVIIEEPTIICHPGDCTVLNTNIPSLYQTTNYSVSAIPYNPNVPFQWDGITDHIINASSDDVWSSIVNLPFTFCFYGNNYNQLLVGSNGVVTFNTQNAGGDCPWQYSTSIPNTSFPIKNAIYGVYQDTDIRTITNGGAITNSAIQNVNFYTLDLGINTAPNRVFVINFNELPHYQCGNLFGLQTSQILLYEATNIIEVLVKNRISCPWNSGNGVIGLQNQDGTIAHVPPGRNTGNWTATNEAWRFSPNGAQSPATFQWYKDGLLIPNQSASTLVACPIQSQETYSVNVSFPNCIENIILSKSIVLNVGVEAQIVIPNDISICSSNTFETFNIDQTATILGALNPNDFEVNYYTSLSDATNDANRIININTFSSQGQTIFVRIENVITSCFSTTSFNLTINPPPVPPTGNANQTFTVGATLVSLIVEGTNILWYSQATGGEPLPITTVLISGTTYYASQTNASNCESRSVNSNRLAVTVSSTLNNSYWEKYNFKSNPNPVKNIFNISFNKNISNVSVYNLVGQEVITKSINANQSQIDMSNLSRGTYLVKVTAENQVKTIKVIKE